MSKQTRVSHPLCNLLSKLLRLPFAFFSTTSNARSFEALPNVSYAFVIFDSSNRLPHEFL